MDARERALGFLEELLKRDTGKLYTLTGKERGQLLEHMECNHPALIVAAFLAFLNRPEELSGLKKPYSLFIGQLREWLCEVTGQHATNLAKYFDTELSIQRGLSIPSFLKAGAELVKFQCELIDWNMNFVRIWRSMSPDERESLDDWEKANIDGQVGTSDWPGWEGKMPPRPRANKSALHLAPEL